MAKKHNQQPREPIAEYIKSDKNQRGNSVAEQELKARHIVSTMTEIVKIRDMRNRRQLAENLGRILSKRKERLNLTDLVVDAGISKNPDPSRLGRFRLLPGKKVDQASIKRLSQDALAYVRLVKEIAKATGEGPSALIEELVLGTRFDPSGLEGVEIEPFEQLHEIIQRKINALDAKYDLTGYFGVLRKHNLRPLWSGGPTCIGRVISRHTNERSKIIGWEKAFGANVYDQERYEAMPCVPLCRIRQSGDIQKNSVIANIKIGDFENDHAQLDLYWRLFLGIGMFDHEHWVETGEIAKVDDEFGEIRVTKVVTSKDPSPQPYLVITQELQYDPAFEFLTDGFATHVSVTGGVDYQTVPLFFYDESTDLKILSVEGHDRMVPSQGMEASYFGIGYLDMLERIYPLGLSMFRDVFGKTRKSGEESFSQNNLAFKEDDALNTKNLTMTLAPHGTIAELMESSLLASFSENGEANSNLHTSFLDKLEDDASRMTSHLQEWVSETQSNLNKQHKSILDQYDCEYEEAKEKV